MKISLEHRWNVTDRGNRSAGRKTCPSTTLSTAHPTTMVCAGRKPNYETTRRRIPDDSAAALTALSVQLACPYKCVGRTVDTLPLHSIVLTSELRSSAPLSLHPQGKEPLLPVGKASPNVWIRKRLPLARTYPQSTSL